MQYCWLKHRLYILLLLFVSKTILKSQNKVFSIYIYIINFADWAVSKRGHVLSHITFQHFTELILKELKTKKWNILIKSYWILPTINLGNV